MFGTSGVRGRVGGEVTPELALKFGNAVGRDADVLTVGRDPRLTGEGLENAVVSGALAAGADVERVGVAPTPCVARYASDKALVVTASHNPAEYNGFKVFNRDGTAYDEEQRGVVEDRIREGTRYSGAHDFGEEFFVEDAVTQHIQDVLASVGSADLKVVVDGASGAAASVTPHLLAEMGCSVVTVNCDVDGEFPAREPEPVEENLTDLMGMVRAEDADLGLAHDGDGDRTAAVDGEGNYVEPDQLLALLADYLGAERVVVPLNTSMVVDSVADATRTPVGDVYVAEKLKETGNEFGGEPSNSWIFPDETYCPDGVHAAAVICSLAAEQPLEERVQGLPSFVVRRGSHECSDKVQVMEQVQELVRERYKEYSGMDGVRAEVDGGWFLIRASGTEPLIRVTAEARDEEHADRIYDEAEEILLEAMDE